jgi:hypothetical protein
MKLFAILGLAFLMGADAYAVNCSCRVQTGNTWPSSGTIVYNYSDTDVTRGVGSNTAEKKCTRYCQDKVRASGQSQMLANQACSKGVGSGSRLNAISKAGAIASGGVDHLVGILTNSAAVYNCPQGGSISAGQCVSTAAITYTCPSGWLSNTTNANGGVTGDGKCKKDIGCNLPAPQPANGTQIGTYGFTWGNAVVIWGNAQNGGSAVASCPAGFSISNGMCRKSYPANLVSAAVCAVN